MPLHMAARAGHAEIVRLLLNHGALIFAVTCTSTYGIMAHMDPDDIDWVEISLPPNFDPPLINPGDIDYARAQEVIKAETSRLSNRQLSGLLNPSTQERELLGPPLSLEECQRLCPTDFVYRELFRPKDASSQKDPKRKYQPKLSDLQHVALARVLMQKFVEKHKTVPNNHQIAMYFIQQVICEQILGREVQWDSIRGNMGVGKGRPAARKRARDEGTEVPRTKPTVLTQEAHDNLLDLAREGETLLTQGHTTASIQESLRIALEEKVAAQVRVIEQSSEISILREELQRYKELYGPLPPKPQNQEETEEELILRTTGLADL